MGTCSSNYEPTAGSAARQNEGTVAIRTKKQQVTVPSGPLHELRTHLEGGQATWQRSRVLPSSLILQPTVGVVAACGTTAARLANGWSSVLGCSRGRFAPSATDEPIAAAVPPPVGSRLPLQLAPGRMTEPPVTLVAAHGVVRWHCVMYSSSLTMDGVPFTGT
mmetsp:Transcript_123062/g.244972  ORF Transcript_123062/g.244972 Transcript_123062/m.244972 type:complete len:163 (-) Transcript_123062:715-1203(-)